MNGLKTDINEELDEEYAPITTAELNADFEEVFEQGGGIGTKNITENGTYESASDGLAGYSEVVVNVNSATPQVDPTLLPESDSTKIKVALKNDFKDLFCASYKIGNTANVDCTLYTVVKCLLDSYGDWVLFGSIAAFTNGNLPCFYRTNGVDLYTSNYGSNVATIYKTNVKHVLAMSLNQTTKKVKFYVDGVELTTNELSFANSGSNVSVGYAAPGVNESEIDFIGAVSEVESSETIIANMQHLMEVFEIS